MVLWEPGYCDKSPGNTRPYPCASSRMPLSEELTVGAEAGKPQGVFSGQAVDEQQVRLDVAFPVIGPMASQGMITMLGLQWHVIRQCHQDGREYTVESLAMTPAFPLVILPECR